MKTIYFTDSEADLEKAAELIKKGKLVAFPTETVYGLGADALNEAAVKNVYKAKGRPCDNPMIVHISHFDDLKLLAEEIPEDASVLADRFWPGPLTMIMNKKPAVPKVTTGGLDTVAVRMPSDKVALKLIEKSGCAIAAPSANLSGKPSPTKWEHASKDLDGRIEGIIRGGDCQVGIESTVLDLTGEIPTILRPGIVTASELSEVLGKPVEMDRSLFAKIELKEPGYGEGSEAEDEDRDGGETEKASGRGPKSPGMKYKHYAPKGQMVIFQGDRAKVDLAVKERRQKAEAEGLRVKVISFDDSREAARDFFKQLRDADDEGAELILAYALEENEVGFSVMNRMLKSAGYNVVQL